MSDQHCEMARERIPDLVAGRSSQDEAAQLAGHLSACAECAAEAELVTLLYEARSEPPEGLASRIQGAARMSGCTGSSAASAARVCCQKRSRHLIACNELS